MKFKTIKISYPNPWKFPSRYPYILLEGPGKPLSNEENERIIKTRKEWHPSNTAKALYDLIRRKLGATLILKVENPENYYDSEEDLPKEFRAELKGAVIEKIHNVDMEFEQFFILLSNPMHLNGDSIFKEYNYDYNSLLKEHQSGLYKINFFSTVGLSIEQTSWLRFFKRRNSS